MSSFGVVLDANVLFPASLRDTLLRNASSGLYRLNWTDEILEEVSRNLVASGKMTKDKAARLLEEMKNAFPEAMLGEHYKSLVTSMTNHPKDRHVLAAAVASGSQLIVTNNLKDFPDQALAPFNIQAQSPDTFLVHQFHLNRPIVTQNIKKQAAELVKPPMTIDELLDALKKHTPEFVQAVKQEII